MKKAWDIFRAIIVALVVMLIATPISLYIILSAGWAQNDIRKVAVNELSALFGTDVNIGKVEIHPFNRLSIYDISARDDYGQPSMKIEEISVAFELFYLLRTGRLVIDFALVDAPEISLYKKTSDSPLNIADIINNLKSDRPGKAQSKYDLRANTVIVRNGMLHYDVLDAAFKDSVFDKNHIKIDNIFLNAYIPHISNDEYRVEIDRFGFHEKNGFSIDKLEAAASITPHGSKIEKLIINFPNSKIDFEPIKIDNENLGDIEKTFATQGISVGIKPESAIYPPDFASFVPSLKKLTDQLDIYLDAHVSSNDISIERLTLSERNDKLSFTLKAAAENLGKDVDADLRIEELRVFASSTGIKDISHMITGDVTANKFIRGLKPVDSFSARLTSEGRINSSRLHARLSLAGNTVTVNGSYDSRDSLKSISFKTNGDADLSNLAIVTQKHAPISADTRFSVNGRVAGKSSQITVNLDSMAIDYNGYKYSGLYFFASANHSKAKANLLINDPMLHAEADCYFEMTGKRKFVDATVTIDEARLNDIHLITSYPGFSFAGSIDGVFEFTNIDDINGSLTIDNLNFSDNDSNTPDLKIKSLTIDTQPNSDAPGVLIKSDFLNGYINGSYNISSLYPMLKEMAYTVFPAIDNETSKKTFSENDYENNNFSFNFKVEACENLCNFFKLPFSIIYPIDINGHFSAINQSASLTLDAPYLLQGDKIIETTSVRSSIDAGDDRANVYATTKMPTKKGPMVIVANMSGASNRIDNSIDWVIERKIPINGSFNFSTQLLRDEEDNELYTSVEFNPGTLTFGEDVWSIKPSVINLAKKQIKVDHFALNADDKSIAIDGIISGNEDDKVEVALKNIALLEIFETLEIDKALIGGTATGEFTGRNLLTPEPEIYCNQLHVDNISYNRCILGNADISAYWDNDKKSFYLDADITGDTGLKSRIFGDIFPAGEALDINFDVNHVPVGFMKPFMSAFASDLKGHASGRARLFGTFKYIDMEGDIYADDLKIKIDFTNTWYSATDTIKLRPGVIDIKEVTIRDINGHTAMLNGVVRHKFFKEPSFKFSINEARNFLSYNVDANQSPDWYGTIYGNGGATISGEPGVVNIGVKMATAPKSAFTFVLSDRLDADEYSFITFKDSKAEAIRDSLLAADDTPAIVKMLRDRLGVQDGDTPSAYNMDLQIDITPDARMVLVMDPVAGDEIKANGAGNLRLTYESLNNDLKMYGTYTLDRGSYNFTLQDIIIKDFTIREGSTIAFHGDPYSAQLDIQAIYSVNANLSDLDESFLLDKDLNRTNVPVHALLKVSGDMRQPDIDFDLEFPTLTQDTYRKVKSIVSTQEMMNRQIIYLLALNRFYTPDYMASTTKGNELFSVASSTISSQLSSMLGKLSEDWSIAPNLRSDRGDFSDVEVDVALSSRLLNNRLLFNGNFGYRDKTLNTNQFIGDFDIEYLLNPKGSWRLKAYNRYNDQNYYVRTAQTTQGIGIVFKKDFDNFFGFLHPKKKKIKPDKPDTINEPNVIVIPDSIAHPANPFEQ